MSNSEKNAFFSKLFQPPILISWNPVLYTFLCTKIKKFTMDNFLFWCMLSSHVRCNLPNVRFGQFDSLGCVVPEIKSEQSYTKLQLFTWARYTIPTWVFDQEKLKAEKGCPIKRAEKMFYEHNARSLTRKLFFFLELFSSSFCNTNWVFIKIYQGPSGEG